MGRMIWLGDRLLLLAFFDHDRHNPPFIHLIDEVEIWAAVGMPFPWPFIPSVVQAQSFLRYQPSMEACLVTTQVAIFKRLLPPRHSLAAAGLGVATM